jgi:O-antigen/teichoic acid export membrane protein
VNITKEDVYFYISFAIAIYFAILYGAWIYFMNIILGIPTFLLSYFFWKKGKKKDPKINRYNYIRYIWLCGIPIAVISLIGYLIFD